MIDWSRLFCGILYDFFWFILFFLPFDGNYKPATWKTFVGVLILFLTLAGILILIALIVNPDASFEVSK